ncbi:MAG: AMIN-like domain-containing (lipo)protein [Actinomycetota bacterium]
MRRVVAVLSVLVFAAVACGGDGEDNTSARPTPSVSPSPKPCSVPNGSTERRESDIRPETAPLTDVRYDDDGCPRIVFEFPDHEPDYVVEYAEPPFSECGSGDAVPTSAWGANAYLTVRLEPSGTADLTKEEAPLTYEGGRDIDVGGDVLKHLKVICDFESVLQWVVGLDERHDFTVFALDDPPRVVIDISQT